MVNLGHLRKKTDDSLKNRTSKAKKPLKKTQQKYFFIVPHNSLMCSTRNSKLWYNISHSPFWQTLTMDFECKRHFSLRKNFYSFFPLFGYFCLFSWKNASKVLSKFKRRWVLGKAPFDAEEMQRVFPHSPKTNATHYFIVRSFVSCHSPPSLVHCLLEFGHRARPLLTCCVFIFFIFDWMWKY